MRYRKPNFPSQYSARTFDFRKVVHLDHHYLKTPYVYLNRNIIRNWDKSSTDTLEVREFNAVHLLAHKNYTYNIPNQITYNKLFHLYVSFPIFIRDIKHILTNIGLHTTKTFNQDVLTILELAVLGRVKNLNKKTLLDIPDYIWVKYFWDVSSNKDTVAFRYVGYLDIEQELIAYFLSKSTNNIAEIPPLIDIQESNLLYGRYGLESDSEREKGERIRSINASLVKEIIEGKGWVNYISNPPKTIHDYEYYLRDGYGEFVEQRGLFTNYIASLISDEYKISNMVSYERLVHYIYNFEEIADLIDEYFTVKVGFIFSYDKTCQEMRNYEEQVLFTNDEVDSKKDELVSIYANYVRNPYSLTTIENLKQFLISKELIAY